jgi:hypothetical protein
MSLTPRPSNTGGYKYIDIENTTRSIAVDVLCSPRNTVLRCN